MNIKMMAPCALLLSIISSSALAKVSLQQASELGNTLTPMGAEQAGNKDGTIPSYKGGLAGDKHSDPTLDIFANEQPLYTITAKNLAHYRDKLSDGQVALFNKFPDSYSMPVYPTHRTAAYPQRIYEKAKKNATRARLVDEGNGMNNFNEAVPFAIPQSGLEVIWNHISRYRGGSVERNSASLPVQTDGSYVPVKVRSQMISPHYLKGGYDAREDDNVLFYFTSTIKSPARLSGNILLIHETIDQVNQPRMAWKYNSGQRRVRRAPQVSYDAPVATAGDLRTSDQTDMFNGAPDKYNWKLVGKQEVYIPYNSYKLMDPNVSYADIVAPGHIDQSYTRYELHRVWKVEATLKEGERHVYGKRTFYVDEDSWQIALADHYDSRGELWRVAEGHAMQFVNADTLWYASSTSYDLMSGRYLVTLNNEEKNAFKFGKKMKRKQFTSAAIRRQGKR